MAKISKRKQAIRAKVDPNREYPLDEALELARELATAKFRETVEVAVNLGVDPRKSDQMVRGSTVLPNGTGKSTRVAVFAQGDQAEAAESAGADVVGFEDLAERVQGGELDFDVVIATPDAMRVVGRLGQILGPRGLMPNPKVGTVTQDVAQAVKNAKAGQVRYRTDKNGIIHAPIGKIDFEASALRENLQALINDLNKAKPSTSKGMYMKRITVASTMGPGLKVDKASLTL
jgi:large subunit ribosomal protein L1